MNDRSRNLWTRYVGLGTLTAALLAGSALVATPADALLSPGPGAACFEGTPGPVPAARRIPDTARVTPATLDRVARDVAAARTAGGDAQALSGSRTGAAALPVYRVKVQIHIIHGTHKRERRVKRRGAHRLFRILKQGYAGAQSPTSEPMGVEFVLKRITISKNDRWFHARPLSRADRQMKRRLHGGTARTLNIYLNKPPRIGGFVLLGYSRFPWQYRGHKTLDGVNINIDAIPGGHARNYNLGDTVVHETGHWFGLLHTFQGGCANSDGVADTPAEAMPSYKCEVGRNTCPVDPVTGMPVDDGLPDPIHNFMDYSYDSCMYEFTRGQHERLTQMFATYRLAR